MPTEIEKSYTANRIKIREICERKIRVLDNTNFKFMLESKIDSKNKLTFFVESRETKEDEETKVCIRSFLNGMFYRGFDSYYICLNKEDSDEYDYSPGKNRRKWYHRIDTHYERGDVC